MSFHRELYSGTLLTPLAFRSDSLPTFFTISVSGFQGFRIPGPAEDFLEVFRVLRKSKVKGRKDMETIAYVEFDVPLRRYAPMPVHLRLEDKPENEEQPGAVDEEPDEGDDTNVINLTGEEESASTGFSLHDMGKCDDGSVDSEQDGEGDEDGDGNEDGDGDGFEDSRDALKREVETVATKHARKKAKLWSASGESLQETVSRLSEYADLFERATAVRLQLEAQREEFLHELTKAGQGSDTTEQGGHHGVSAWDGLMSSGEEVQDHDSSRNFLYTPPGTPMASEHERPLEQPHATTDKRKLQLDRQDAQQWSVPFPKKFTSPTLKQ